jgi:hypothetical protein
MVAESQADTDGITAEKIDVFRDAAIGRLGDVVDLDD